MNADQLRTLQSPLKELYREQPEQAVATLSARGTVNMDTLTCDVEITSCDDSTVTSGLHPKAGGDGQAACSGDMLLQSLVACSGVTLAAVATAMEIDMRSAQIEATGSMDFRGTLGIDRETSVGLQSVGLTFKIDSDAPGEKLDKLVELTERYCVVLQTLKSGTEVTTDRV